MADEVRVDVKLDTSDAEAKAKGLKGLFTEMGKIAGGIALANLGAQGLDLAKQTLSNSITLARDYNEILSKSNTIFGEQAREIEKWAGTASTAFGQSKAQALDAAASFGNMFTQLGLTDSEAAKMSTTMTELASDFASFHNADITEVLNAQQAAFRGEYDAVQRFVPTINAAAVEMKALEQTGKSTTKELTAQEKAVAAYALMMEGAGDAMGDFERTSGSLSNQQRVLSAQWADLQTQIGQALIPALTTIVTTINTQVIPAVKDFAEKTRQYWESDIKPAIDNLITAWEKVDQVVIPLLKGVATEIKLMAQIFADTVQLILAIISGDWGRAWDEAKAIVQGFVDVFKNRIETLKTVLTEAIPLVVEGAKELGKAIFDAIWEGLGDLWQIGADIIHWLLQGLKDMAWQVTQWVTEFAGGLVDKLNPANIIKNAGGALGGLGSSVLPLVGGGAPWMLSGGGGGASVPAVPTGAYGNPLTWNGSAWVEPNATGYNPSQAGGGVYYGLGGGPGGGVVINIDTVNAQNEAEAASAVGNIAYALQSKGLLFA